MCRDSIQRVNQPRFQTGVLCTRVNCITVSHYIHAQSHISSGLCRHAGLATGQHGGLHSDSACLPSPALISPCRPPTKTVLVGSRRGDGHLIELLSERAHGITCTCTHKRS